MNENELRCAVILGPVRAASRATEARKYDDEPADEPEAKDEDDMADKVELRGMCPFDLAQALELGLPIDPRGAAAAREATDSYASSSIRLAGIRRDVLRLAARDGLQCHYCGIDLTERTLQVDHVIPKTKGGSNQLSNLVLSCAGCNGKKGARDYRDFKSGCPT